jgi:hypothetical protein
MEQPTKLQKAEDALFEKLIPGITTLATMGRKGFIKSISNVVQRQRKEGWLEAFLVEWNELCEQGKIKPNFIESEQGEECRQELLDSLDIDKPDKDKFEAMKKIFLKAATAPEKEWESSHPQQLMKVCRTLSSEELIILGVAYHLYSTMSPGELERGSRGSDGWPRFIEKHSSGRISEGMVFHYEDDLVRKQIIGGRANSDRSGINYVQQCRLAPLGIELGKFLSK